MVAAAIKHMASNFAKLDKFERVDFRRWQKKIHFLLSSMSVVYVLTTLFPKDDGDDETNFESFKELWDSLKAKYMAGDASSKKFLVSNFKNYKMTDSRPVLEQYNKLLGILRRFTQHKMNMDEGIKVSCIIDKLLPFWKDFKHTLKHKRDELTLVELHSHLCIEKPLRMMMLRGNESTTLVRGRGCVNLRFSSGKIVSLLNALHVPNIRKNLVSSSVLNHCGYKHVIESNKICSIQHGMSQGLWGESMLTACYLLNRVLNKRNMITPYELWTKRKPNLDYLMVWGCRAVVRHPDPKLKTLGERGIKCIFVGYAEHSKAFRDVASDQHSYCFNVEDDPKTFDETMKSRDVAFWKESINDEMDSIMGNNIWVLVDQPPGCKWIFKRKLKVDGTIEKFKPRMVIQGFKQKSGIGYFDTYALVARISTIRLLIAIASIHNLIIHQIDVKTTFLNGELEEEATQRVLKYLKKTMDYRLTYTGYPLVLEGYTDASWINNNKDNSSTSGWIFLLGGGEISWASKKQTCITGLTMEYEFVVSAAAGKEAKWLKKLFIEISLWVKPIAPISIRYDSAATLVKAYSQMYNRKSRHLGVRHNMIHELIINGVVSIEFVRSQQNLADHLTKGLTRDMVIKSVEGMR
nr:zinc finger, CCHC-type [Tanacetum cinerariifolium]